MIFGDVRLPDAIRIALEENRLVIFAGAGVSKGAPSNLPLFPGLVKQIGDKVGRVSGVGLREDEILGRWAREGVPVHEIASQIIMENSSQFTDVHRGILRVFGDVERVRVVTTNFDSHFSDAASEIFPAKKLTTYTGPAIPLGDDFEGLVYLHGAAKVSDRKMVLTDEDFGQAYLTRGWAKDFLVSLFSKFSVLFVGYSHNDVVVTYLARGMRKSQQRWTLVPASMDSSDRERWKHLDIESVEYPVGNSKETEHDALGHFFLNWAEHCGTSVLGHSAQIKAIARVLPPESSNESEYIEYCLGQNSLAKDFFETIQHPAWLGWLLGRKYVEPLFSPKLEEPGPRERWLANWLCTYVRREYPEQLLGLIQQYDNKMSPLFSNTLSDQLWGAQSKEPIQRFEMWVSLLLNQGVGVVPITIWGYIFKECRLPEHGGVALRLFEMLTTPRLVLKKHWDFNLSEEKQEVSKTGVRKVDYEIEWVGEQGSYWLKEDWKDGLHKLIECRGERLLGIVTRHLSEAYSLLHDVSESNPMFDSLSWGRSSISDHEQDESPIRECVSQLINIARDILEYWLRNSRNRALAQIDIWWSLDQSLFRRLCIHGVTLDSGRSANAKLIWLLESDQIFAFGMKKEVFDLLKSAYPSGTSRIKRRMIARINRGIVGARAENLDARTVAYEKFNVLKWLKRNSLECPEVERALKRIARDYPEFRVSDHPEFSHWHGKAGFIDPKEGFDFDKIITEPADSYLNDLMASGDKSFHRDRWSYCSNLSTLFAINRDWGAQFMSAMVLRNVDDKSLWLNVFSGWRETIKSKEDWVWMLGACEALPRQSAVLGGISHVLSHGFWSDSVAPDSEMVSRADRLITSVWEVCRFDPEPMDSSNHDWLTDAINHRGGWIAEFWIHHLSFIRKSKGKRWRGIPHKRKLFLIEALDGGNAVRSYARIALIPWIAYLFIWDKKLVREHFLPLFDWKRDAVVAQQSWSVFLNYRHATNTEWELDLLKYVKEFMFQLRPMVQDATQQEEQFGDRTLERLGGFLAGFAMQVISDPVESGFFTDFLPVASDKVRLGLIHGMGRHLSEMGVRDKTKVWQLWLRRYLNDRAAGIPAALSFDEANGIVTWVAELGSLFPEAVEILSKVPLRNAPEYSFVKKLIERDLASQYPIPACRMCNQVLESVEQSWGGEGLNELHDIFELMIVDSSEFKRFLEIRYNRGWRPEAGSE